MILAIFVSLMGGEGQIHFMEPLPGHFPPVQYLIIPTVTAHLLAKAKMFVRQKADPNDQTAAGYEKKLKSQSFPLQVTHHAAL